MIPSGGRCRLRHPTQFTEGIGSGLNGDGSGELADDGPIPKIDDGLVRIAASRSSTLARVSAIPCSISPVRIAFVSRIVACVCAARWPSMIRRTMSRRWDWGRNSMTASSNAMIAESKESPERERPNCSAVTERVSACVATNSQRTSTNRQTSSLSADRASGDAKTLARSIPWAARTRRIDSMSIRRSHLRDSLSEKVGMVEVPVLVFLAAYSPLMIFKVRSAPSDAEETSWTVFTLSNARRSRAICREAAVPMATLYRVPS